MKKTLFIGHFSSGFNKNKRAVSLAGDIVQKEIASCLNKNNNIDNSYYLSMEPMPCWPNGPLLIKSENSKDLEGRYIGYINLPVIKNIIFAINILLEVILTKPCLVIQYNSYLFENIAILLSKIFGCKTGLIIQDCRIGKIFSKFASWHDQLSNSLVKYFDYVLPVSDYFARTLGLKNNQYTVVPGGVTSFSSMLKPIDSVKFTNKAIFAGALEKHNGIDKIVDFWIKYEPKVELHIYGGGSLVEFVISAIDGSSNVFFHGVVSQRMVAEVQADSKFNFCLRYSEGLDERYFFPSKFFNVSMCPGLLLSNDFYGLPKDVVDEDFGLLIDGFKNIQQCLELDDDSIKNIAYQRIEIVKKYYSWEHHLEKIIEGVMG
jgi:glycosyltransferase involved in cell wall biosynthesis